MAVDRQNAERAFSKIQPFRKNAAVVCILHKAQLFMAHNGVCFWPKVICQLVADIFYLLGTLPRQVTWNAVRGL